MASVAAMSVSVFHRWFKLVTGMSPLQYQKHIRLHEARRRMLTERAEAATVGFSVGYESTSQFSREDKRLFGHPPRKDASVAQALSKRHCRRSRLTNGGLYPARISRARARRLDRVLMHCEQG
ncbi:helix-turn-helix transcriptional regulator [Brucella pituitosa]|uniref:Helix-turn-helix transcriptional regulator n=2 Tax=Brucella pituitosa TaxID=571256 RepID=A0ABS3K2N8_9HYPH|nr:helix-turn-helix transcriptional regulator [Brucella pituitosa]